MCQKNPEFNSSIPIDPTDIITADGNNGLCTLNGGNPVANDSEIKFYYVWRTMFSFVPVSSNISCYVA